jgi:RNA polymerase sigma-70 factor (sigma-E family)
MTRTGTDSGATHEDQLLVRRYRQVTDAQATRYAATYDIGTGLARFRDWLREHTAADEDHFSGAADAAAQADPGDCPGAVWPAPAAARLDAGQAVMQLYAAHHRALVRLATLLVRDIPTAEEVVQDAFIGMRDAWHRLRDPEQALAYLRQAVVNRSRSVLRHRTVADKNPQPAPPDMPSAEDEVLLQLQRSQVVAALRELPARQREAIVLRYYADLSEAEIAAAMGISRGAVKSHTARGMAAFRAAMEQEEPWRP